MLARVVLDATTQRWSRPEYDARELPWCIICRGVILVPNEILLLPLNIVVLGVVLIPIVTEIHAMVPLLVSESDAPFLVLGRGSPHNCLHISSAGILPQAEMIQSVFFPRPDFTVQQAVQWLHQHGLRYHKIDITEHHLRFR